MLNKTEKDLKDFLSRNNYENVHPTMPYTVSVHSARDIFFTFMYFTFRSGGRFKDKLSLYDYVLFYIILQNFEAPNNANFRDSKAFLQIVKTNISLKSVHFKKTVA